MHYDQKVIRPGESQIEFIHQVCTQNDLRFICKCKATTQPITAYEAVRIEWNMTKSLQGLGSPVVRSPTKFDLNPICGLPWNAQKWLNQS